jgi:hypothetical protein
MQHVMGKEKWERCILDGFIAKSGLCAGGKISRLPQDPPDFVVTSGPQQVGIEVTRIFVDGGRGSRLQAGTRTREWVCQHVGCLLSASGVAPMHIFIGFTYDDLHKNKGDLAKQVASLITSNDPSDDEAHELDWRPFAEIGEWDRTWPADIDHISMLRPAGWNSMEVTHVDAGWERENCVDLIQDALNDKSFDLSKYPSTIGERWLLICAEGHDVASFIDPDDATKSHVYVSGFDRAFFYRHAFGSWFELKMK